MLLSRKLQTKPPAHILKSFPRNQVPSYKNLSYFFYTIYSNLKDNNGRWNRVVNQNTNQDFKY